MLNVAEPTADCQREIVRALVNLVEGRGTRAGTLVELELHDGLTEYQWDRCWWNARWWARNEDSTTYELFRLAGKGCPIVVDEQGARVAVSARYPDLVKAALEADQKREEMSMETPTLRAVEQPIHEVDARLDLRVRAIRFVQNGRVFYSAVMPAAEIIARSRVDEWSADVPEEEAGYQRAPMGLRLRAVANYMEDPNAVMPVGGLLNARSPEGSSYGDVLSFEPDDTQDGHIQSGWLTVPASATPLYIVDMQHRLLGIARAIEDDGRTDLADYPMLLTIADGLSKLAEEGQDRSRPATHGDPDVRP
jgi:hypothetical protein